MVTAIKSSNSKNQLMPSLLYQVENFYGNVFFLTKFLDVCVLQLFHQIQLQ